MTKPITAVAALMLWEEGWIELTDPVSRYIPSFAGARGVLVVRSRSRSPIRSLEEMRLWHLFTHTAGLIAWVPVGPPRRRLYRRAGFEWVTPPGADLADVCDRLAGLPLLFQPGREGTTAPRPMCSAAVEVASGLSLDEFFASRIFEPLGMVEHRLPRPRTRTAPARRAYIPTPGTRQILRMDAPRLELQPAAACLAR